MDVERRIAAIVLPELLVELARPPSASGGREDDAYTPIAVVLQDPSRPKADKPATPIVAAVNRAAHACGVRPLHTVVEASAHAARLHVRTVDEASVQRALASVAEVAFGFGATVHVEADERGVGDSVWVDVSGGAHLFGGEDMLASEIIVRVGELGFTVRAAIADGPRIAEAIARFGHERVSPRGAGRASLAKLPLRALRPMPSKPGAPLGAFDDGVYTLFARLGVFTVEDLLALPHAELTARLRYQDVSQGTRSDLLMLGMGTDRMPLTPYRPADVLTEDVTFDDPIELTEPLLFVLRRLTSRLAARLAGRGQATNHLELVLHYDAKIHAREIDAEGPPRALFAVQLPAPLATEIDLFRTLKSKVEGVEIAAPIVGLDVTLSRIVDAPHAQLDLSRDVTSPGRTVRPDALPALLAELSADIGDENVGVLAVVDTHRPEARGKLVAPGASSPRKASRSSRAVEAARAAEAKEPTRLLPEPIPLGSVSVGATVFVGRAAFEIVRVAFDRRLDGIEWWSRSNEAVSRDYLNVWLAARSHGSQDRSITEGWAYVDRATGQAFLHGLWE